MNAFGQCDSLDHQLLWGEIDVVGSLPPALFSQPVNLVEGFRTLPVLRLNRIPPRPYMFVHSVWHLFHFKCLGASSCRLLCFSKPFVL